MAGSNTVLFLLEKSGGFRTFSDITATGETSLFLTMVVVADGACTFRTFLPGLAARIAVSLSFIVGGNSLRPFSSCPHSCPNRGAAFSGQPWNLMDSVHGHYAVSSRSCKSFLDPVGRVSDGGGG